MIRRWPDTLPHASFPGFNLRPRDQSRRTDMEVGPKRVRRLTFAELEVVTAPFRFDAAQMSAFKDWYYDRRVSISGASDTITGWYTGGTSTVVAAQSLSPDLVPADRLLETATSGWHNMALELPEASADNVPLVLTATLRPAGRQRVRMYLAGRDGAHSSVTVDLATGTILNVAGTATAVRVTPRGDGWWRVSFEASTGVGVATPVLVVDLNDAFGSTVYPGSPSAGVDVCEVQARVRTGQDLFVPCDADGYALGAAGGSAWFRIALATDGREVSAEARMDEMWNGQIGAALSGEVTLTMEVRNA